MYSTIAPVTLLFAALYFGVQSVVMRHQHLYVYDAPWDTGGRYFTRAVQQVFTGLYILLLTVTGILFLKQAYPAGLAVLAAVPVVARLQVWLAQGYRALSRSLPVSGGDGSDAATEQSRVSPNSTPSKQDEPRSSSPTSEDELLVVIEDGTHLQRKNNRTEGEEELVRAAASSRVGEAHSGRTSPNAGTLARRTFPGAFPLSSLLGPSSNASASTSHRPLPAESRATSNETAPVRYHRRLPEMELVLPEEDVYQHPNIIEPCPHIWLPSVTAPQTRDALRSEIEFLQSVGLEVSTEGASLKSRPVRRWRGSGVKCRRTALRVDQLEPPLQRH